MRNIRLTHTYLCQALLYAPPILLFGGAFPLFYWASLMPRWLEILLAFGALGLMCLALYALIRGAAGYMLGDLTFGTIRAWKRDRKVYRYSGNGSTRREAEAHVLRRAAAWGKPGDCVGGLVKPLGLFYRRRRNWLPEHYSGYADTAVIYSVEKLEKESLAAIRRDAVSRERRLPTPKTRSKLPICHALSVIILADWVDPKIHEDIRKPIHLEGGSGHVCASACSEGLFWMNGEKNYYELGAMACPAWNRALARTARLSMDGLPKGHPEDRMPWPLKDFREDSTFGEFMDLARSLRKGRKGEAKKEARLEKQMMASMQDGRVEYRDDTVFCKQDGKLAAWPVLEDEEQKRLIILPFGGWVQPHRQNMKKSKEREIRALVRATLQARGYEVTFGDEDIKESSE